LVFYIIKGYEALSNVELPWLHSFVMRRYNKIWFPSQKAISGRTYTFHVVKDYGYIHILSILFTCATIIVTFDLWMNWSEFGTFALVMNFINVTQVLIIIGDVLV
jgi:hypothetical protein